MKAFAPAILYALFVWWFSTGLVLLIVLREKAVRASLTGAALLFPVAIAALAVSSGMTNAAGAYIAFTSAILVWATQEVAFLTGYVTGPRPVPCPTDARGYDRFRHALDAILYHEIALVVSGATVAAVTWQAENQTGALTFLVLWIMRISAKLNLFFGVPVLNDEVLPRPVRYLRSYFRRGPVNDLFPVTIVLSVLVLSVLVTAAAGAAATTATGIGYALVATLIGLAILEHVFMLVPLPIGRLWQWSGADIETSCLPVRSQTEKTGDDTKIERAVATSP